MDQGSRSGNADAALAQSGSVQPEQGDEADVDKLAGTREADNLARLQGDRDLVDRLMWRQYTGPEWDLFAHTLAEYGFPVMRAWIRSGRIHAECAKRGLGGLRRREMRGDDAVEVSMETVAVAIHRFRDSVLVPGRWDPRRGASLNTFFIGQCVLRFPNVYRRWLTEQLWFKDQGHAVMTRAAAQEPATARDPYFDLQVNRALALARAEPDRAIVALADLGQTQEEIGAQFGMSAKAVEMRLYRHRGRR